MKEKRMTHVSAKRARRMKDKTDLARVRRQTDAEIVKAARSDPDAAVLPRAFWDKALMMSPQGKRQVTLRLDGDVLDFFRKAGRGYQTRINRVLKAFVEAHNQSR